MKRLILNLSTSIFLVFISTLMLFGQEKKIQGRVTTFDSIPLINARIEVKSTKEVVHSDTLGLFTLKCAMKDKLKVTAEGFVRQNVRIKENTKFVLVNLRLMSNPESRELAVGYGHVKDAEKLYAISHVNENEMDFSKYSDIYDIISEQFSSTAMVQTDGEIVIRGAPVMGGSNAALLILDGRQIDAADFANINPSSIATINILKDASAAVYGSRGGNGVVIVETKRGYNK